MRITSKFFGSSALLIILTAIFSGGSALMHYRSGQRLDEQYAQVQAASTSVSELQLALQDQTAILSRRSILPENATDDARYEEARSRYMTALDQLESIFSDEEAVAQVQLDGLRQRVSYLDLLHQRLQTQTLSLEQAEDIARSLRLFNQNTDSLIQAVDQHVVEKGDAFSEQQRQTMIRALIFAKISFGLVIVLLVGQYFLLLKPVMKALTYLEKEADTLSAHLKSVTKNQTDPGLGKPLNNANNQLDAVQLATEKLAPPGHPRPLPGFYLPEHLTNTGSELRTLATTLNQMSEQLTHAYHTLESKVARRTASLEKANEILHQEIRDRTAAEARLSDILSQLQQTQLQLFESEKVSSLNQLVASVAHEVNNPVSIIQGNLEPAEQYIESLISLLHQYQAECPEASDELSQAIDEADLDFVEADFPRLVRSISSGTERITAIVRSLQAFFHMGSNASTSFDIHTGLESALLILASQLQATDTHAEISIQRAYHPLPKVYCYPAKLNQVFLTLLTAAIERFDDSHTHPQISVTTSLEGDFVQIAIADNGPSLSPNIQEQLFSPDTDQSSAGLTVQNSDLQSTWLGLSMSYQTITDTHQGRLTYEPNSDDGNRFCIQIPLTLKIQSTVLTVNAAA